MAVLSVKSLRRRYRRWIWISLAVLFPILAIPTYEFLARYLSWKTMSKAELIEEADVYLQNYTDGGQACLYAVDCQSGRAVLVLVKDVEAWDIEETKDLVWRRRFSDFCPGQTANFGLHVITTPASDQITSLVESNRWARWSFYNDRFLPSYGRFQGGAFSEGQIDRCTEPYAVVRREPGPPNRH